jgi:hypothetical protein
MPFARLRLIEYGQLEIEGQFGQQPMVDENGFDKNLVPLRTCTGWRSKIRRKDARSVDCQARCRGPAEALFFALSMVEKLGMSCPAKDYRDLLEYVRSGDD